MTRTDHRSASEVNVESFSTDEMIDHYSDRTAIGLFEQERRAIERYFEPGSRVLDVGCGTGRTTYPLWERGFEVVGVDVSEGMVERARDMFPHLDFRVGDVTDLAFSDGAFDCAVFAHNGIDYVHPERERERALAELRRILQPDGVLLFGTHNAWYRFPALLADWSFIQTFYLDNGNLGRLCRRYKLDVIEGDPLWTHLTTPPKQRRQLRASGFEPVDIVGKRSGPSRLFEAMLNVVARVD